MRAGRYVTVVLALALVGLAQGTADRVAPIPAAPGDIAPARRLFPEPVVLAAPRPPAASPFSSEPRPRPTSPSTEPTRTAPLAYRGPTVEFASAIRRVRAADPAQHPYAVHAAALWGMEVADPGGTCDPGLFEVVLCDADPGLDAVACTRRWTGRAGDIVSARVEWLAGRWPAELLRRAACHEVGHALGLGHSDNPASCMFPDHRRVGPAPTDVDRARVERT